jgi:hypothetical protein
MSEASYRRYVLGQLRMARVRAKLLINEIDTIGKALKGEMIEPDAALVWLTGHALALVQCEPAATIEYEATGEVKTNGGQVSDGMREDRASNADQAIGERGAADAGAAVRQVGSSAA